jgi:hypothetical protein
MVTGMDIVVANENYSGWTYTTDITLDTSPSGADVSLSEKNFPVLIRLTSSNFIFSEAQGRGQDIRFAKPSGAPIDYEIERWDSVAAAAEIWIKMDTIFGNTAGQAVKMFWGNPSATDSSNGNKVFSATNNYSAVWHLGTTGIGIRPNSVAGGNSATPINYDGDETATGIIGLADNLDGAATGDYLQLGAGYSQFKDGFTYSVWANPTARGYFDRLLDLGNGAGSDNIIVMRVDSSADLAFLSWKGGVTGPWIKAPGGLALNEWQYYTFTVSGLVVKIYRNGVLITTGTGTDSITSVTRSNNYLGRSAFGGNTYFKGSLDEPELSVVARSDSWVKLCYQNQKPNQGLVRLKAPNRCQTRFKAPSDTTVSEGASFILKGLADCTSDFSWSAVSGPIPKILDPGVKLLSVLLPRSVGDTLLVYSFTATFADSIRQKDIRVLVKESIPDPIFAIPKQLTWNGADSLVIRPMISNLAEIKSSRDSIINSSWSISESLADTLWLADGLRLKNATTGKMQIELCLDNGYKPSCATTTLEISGSTSKLKTIANKPPKKGRHTNHDLAGRDHILAGESIQSRPEKASTPLY